MLGQGELDLYLGLKAGGSSYNVNTNWLDHLWDRPGWFLDGL